MESNRFRLSVEQTSSLLGQLELCSATSDFNLSADLCTISDILWSIIHKQKHANPELYKALEDKGVTALSATLSEKAYELYNDELHKTTDEITDVSAEKLSGTLKECFKSLSAQSEIVLKSYLDGGSE